MNERADHRVARSELPLAGLRVGISGAVPEREHWGRLPDLDRLILSVVSQLSGLIMDYGGQVVHGSHPSFAPVIAEEARRHVRGGSGAEGPGRSLSSAESKGRPYLMLVASQLWGGMPEVAYRAARIAKAPIILTPKIGNGDAADAQTRNDSLTAMRLTLAQEIDVLIAVGGKLHVKTGFNPGVLEELAQARWQQVPCFIVAGLGGFASNLNYEIVEEFSRGNLMFASGANAKDAIDMATWSDHMEEHVGRLLVHLARHREQLIGSEAPRMFSLGERSSVSHDSVSQLHEFPEALEPSEAEVSRVKEASQQLAQLRNALEQGDVNYVRELLRSPYGALRQPGLADIVESEN